MSTDTVHADQHLIDDQAQKLLQLIEFKTLYRNGNHLYDAQKSRPQYNICEFAWAYCDHPSIATEIANKLELIITDIPDITELSDDETNDVLLQLIRQYKTSCKKTEFTSLSRMILFLFRMIKADRCNNEQLTILRNILRELTKRGWEPAAYYTSMLKKLLK